MKRVYNLFAVTFNIEHTTYINFETNIVLILQHCDEIRSDKFEYLTVSGFEYHKTKLKPNLTIYRNRSKDDAQSYLCDCLSASRWLSLSTTCKFHVHCRLIVLSTVSD